MCVPFEFSYDRQPRVACRPQNVIRYPSLGDPMAKNVEGAKFVSKGIEYILKTGPKGNLRPYKIGPVMATAKSITRIPVLGYLLAGSVVVGGVVLVALHSLSGKGESEEENVEPNKGT